LGKLEEVLRLINEGKRFPWEIAKELGITVGEVEGIIELLKGLGYIEEVERCNQQSCPLRKLCHGRCLLPRAKVLRPRDLILQP